MSHHEPGFECPECGTKLFHAARCMACGWKRTPDQNNGHDAKPKSSCWTCDKCGPRAPSVAMLYQDDGPNGSPRGLCSSCHFDERIRPYRSNADDLCTADECEGSPPHKIARHIAMFRHHAARITERMEALQL